MCVKMLKLSPVDITGEVSTVTCVSNWIELGLFCVLTGFYSR